MKLLTEAPKGYKIDVLNENILFEQENILFIRIITFSYNGNRLNIKAKVLTSDELLNIVFFHVTAYHNKNFAVGNKTLYIKGVVTNHQDYGASIVQPKKVNKPTEKIISIYKSKENEKLLNQYLTAENLIKSKLPLNITERIFLIHKNPTEEIARYFQNYKTFDSESLYTLKFIELYYYMKVLELNSIPKKSLKKLVGKHLSWIETLPFKLTSDQENAINDIAKDLNSDTSSQRIVVGDVGSGKTMVIFASVVIAYPNKSVLMAPTSILAEQLYEEANKFLPKHFNIGLITSRTSKKVDFDFFDFLIGTHALLYRDIGNAPLIMIDEQHRFGTIHRNKLKTLMDNGDKSPHFLQFSATPIPRTQAMINSDFIGVSLIEETPFKKNIFTKTIFSKDFANLVTHIKSEIEKNYQVLLIYPLIEESDNFNYQSLEESKSYWFGNFKNVYLTHGKDKNKNQVLKEFREKGDILLSTSVVEVGISLPRLTTIVIVGAERLGLASLHQLRGRVSRTGLQGYCFLYTKTNKPEALQRLKKFETTKNGFDIASLDLQNRKGGDIISGTKQSGNSFKWFNIASDFEIIEDVRKVLGKTD